jgi:hypothetical protein
MMMRCPCRTFTTPRLVLGGLIALLGSVTPGGAQQQEILPTIQITSREDLTEALVGSPDLYSARLGLIAAQGDTLLSLFRAIAWDETEAEVVRANAIAVLGLLLDSASVPQMVELTRREGLLQTAAFNVLAYSPYSGACVFWRSILRNPSAHSGTLILALSAIRFCGTAADIPLIRAVLRGMVSPGYSDVGERSIVELRNPVAIRYLHTPLEGNFPPMGTYRPPPEIAAEIRAQLCDGACAPGMVVLPSTVAKLYLR